MNGFIQYVLLPLLIFLMAAIFIRLTGKKAVSDMSNFDVLFVIILGVIISGPLLTTQSRDALAYSFIFVLAYVLFTYAAQNRTLRTLLVSPSTVLLRNGDIDEKGLREARMTTRELLSALRQKGYTKTEDVEMAVMEETGKISVIPKSHVRPLQPDDIQLHPTPAGIPMPIIMNGQLLEHNLRFLEKDERWLTEKLQAFGMNMDHIGEISLAVYHQNGTLAVDVERKERNTGSRHPLFNENPPPEGQT